MLKRVLLFRTLQCAKFAKEGLKPNIQLLECRAGQGLELNPKP